VLKGRTIYCWIFGIKDLISKAKKTKVGLLTIRKVGAIGPRSNMSVVSYRYPRPCRWPASMFEESRMLHLKDLGQSLPHGYQNLLIWCVECRKSSNRTTPENTYRNQLDLRRRAAHKPRIHYGARSWPATETLSWFNQSSGSSMNKLSAPSKLSGPL
jgi:hypothetical protein